MDLHSNVLWPAKQVLNFCLMLFGYPYIPPEIYTLLVGIIALVMYAHLVRFILDYIKKLAGLGGNGMPRR
jgi:hypothetical protein